jgi:ATP-dependent Clp protease ATP-binding subunit ClpA
MFERFTDQARRIVVLAREEAGMLNHDCIGTEHILLALIREGTGTAARALASLGIAEEAARQQVEAITGRGQRGNESGKPQLHLNCCQDGRQHLPHMDKCGISAQRSRWPLQACCAVRCGRDQITARGAERACHRTARLRQRFSLQ